MIRQPAGVMNAAQMSWMPNNEPWYLAKQVARALANGSCIQLRYMETNIGPTWRFCKYILADEKEHFISLSLVD